MNIKNKSNDLLGIEAKEDNEEVTNKEMDEWEWQSYHKIDVKQNMGYRGFQHNLTEINVMLILKIWWYNLPLRRKTQQHYIQDLRPIE